MSEPEKTASCNVTLSILEQFRELSKNKLEDQTGNKNTKGIKRTITEVLKDDADTVSTFCGGISEADVGISEYISNNKGFSGIIKHRFSDFQVNEIDPEGNLVELSSFEVPIEVKEQPVDPDFKAVLSEEKWKELEAVLMAEGKDAHLEIDVSGKTKEERSAIHKAIKFVFGSKAYSNTIEKDGEKFLKIGKASKSKERERNPGGVFLHFTLYKEKMDTLQTVHALAKFLTVKPNMITYAGNKDKRGKTTQRMCVKYRSADVLSKFKHNSVFVGNFSYSHESLRLGKLLGNKFKIAIRDVKAENEIISEAMDSLQKNGFINYFGLQRFGFSSDVPTYAVGKALLTSNWEQAVQLILKPKEGERCRSDIKLARKTWWETRDATKAAEHISKFDNTIEGKVLKALKTQGDKAFFNAIFAIPRNSLQLYLHSYQSLIWNRIVSRRIREFGLIPIAGDIIMQEETCSTTTEMDTSQNDSKDEDETNSDIPDHSAENQGKKTNVKILTAEEAKETSIYDIVYPLPGFDVQYPNNTIGDWYREALQMDNLTDENLKSTHKIFSISGTYRKMISKVEDLHWKTVYYKDPNEDLILSDLDRMKNKVLPTYHEDSEHKAVLLEFKLRQSHYATMVLREIMKCTTAGAHQALLSQDHISVDSVKKAKTTDINCDT